jgi:transcriptional regulator with XRE-family HTH domain
MVKLTLLKARRMTLGLRQLDVVLATGIQPGRMSLIENEHIQPTQRELELIEGFLTTVQKQRHDSQVLGREVRVSASP